MNEGLVPMVVKGNEHTDKLLTALTTRHIQAQTLLKRLLLQSICHSVFNNEAK